MKKEIAVPVQTEGRIRFLLPAQELLNLIKSAKGKKNRAYFLYTGGARNHLFRLEAWCRIYRNIQSKKLFDPWYNEFKQVEDQFGKIDFYDAFLQEFSSQKNIPASFLKFYRLHRDEEIKNLESMIRTGGILMDETRLLEMCNQLTPVSWMHPDEERKAIALFLSAQIEKLLSQFENGELHFNDLEHGIHEFRRKLRWISIYAQVLNGLIQLKKVKDIPAGLLPYLEPEIISSPFNILPKIGKGVKPIEIQAPLFYALSWMIQESGKLKDSGLKIISVNQAIKDSDLKSKEGIQELKNRLLPKSGLSLIQIAEKMDRIADEFIHRDRVLSLIRRDLLRSITI